MKKILPIIIVLLLTGCSSNNSDLVNVDKDYESGLDRYSKEEILDYVYDYYEVDIEKHVAETVLPEDLYGKDMLWDYYYDAGYAVIE